MGDDALRAGPDAAERQPLGLSLLAHGCTKIPAIASLSLSFVPDSSLIPSAFSSFINDLTQSLSLSEILGSTCELDFGAALEAVG